MSRATPKMKKFAARLIAHETSGKESSGIQLPAAFHVCEKLRPRLATLMGNAGFRALLARALALANAEVAWLRAVHIKADGSLEGLAELAAQVDPAGIADGSIVLLAQLLGLLETFIGEPLTLQIVRDLWPKLSMDDL